MYSGGSCRSSTSASKPQSMPILPTCSGGLLRSVGCKLRPYETVKGSTDKALARAVEILIPAFEGERTKEDALAQAVSQLAWVDVKKEQRPKVAIFGDFYVRDNSVMNQNLVRFIEANGGEVVTTPYYRFAKMIARTLL